MATAGPPRIFDPARRRARFARAVAIGDAGARYVEDAIVEEVGERLAFLRLNPSRALIVGEIGDTLARALTEGGTAVERVAIGAFDEEQPWPSGGHELIVAVNMLDTVNDLPGAMVHMRAALAQGGIAIAALPAAGSLPALRAAMLAADGARPAGRIHPQIDSRSAAALLQRAGFARQVVDGFPVVATYRALDRLLDDLRGQGLGSCLADPALSPGRHGLRAARRAFAKLADDHGRTRETIEMLMLTGWR